jgi:hypothetical protein
VSDRALIRVQEQRHLMTVIKSFRRLAAIPKPTSLLNRPCGATYVCWCTDASTSNDLLMRYFLSEHSESSTTNSEGDRLARLNTNIQMAVAL